MSDRNYLLSVPLPEQTRSYSPVPHSDIIVAVEEKLYQTGHKINSFQCHVANAGKQVIGKYMVDAGDPELSYMIMFKNSYDKSMSLGFAVGASVMICSNGMVISDIEGGTVARKHTGDVRDELREKLELSMSNMDQRLEIIKSDKDFMKGVTISKRTAAELVGRMVMEEEILNTMQMNIIRRAMDKDPAFAWNGDSASGWTFYNNITESLKRSHPTSMIQDHVNAHKFIKNSFELLA